MLMDYQIIEEDAIWKQRYRAQSILWARIATRNPHRGLVCTNQAGIRQLFAWDVRAGAMRQLTSYPTGVNEGMISAGGDWVYYLRDDGGNEIGHYVRMSFDGGTPQDITPHLPAYNSYEIHQSYDGSVVGVWTAEGGGHSLYMLAEGAEPHLIHKSEHLFFGPSISSRGEIAVIATTEGTHSPDTRLVAFDLKKGEPFALLWDGLETTHTLGEFSPIPGDLRILSTSSKTGYERPLIWNPLTGERRDLVVEEIPGDVVPFCWSADGQQVLLSQHYQAQQQLYLYHVEQGKVVKLNHPRGVFGNSKECCTFCTDGRILLTWQNSTHPSQLIALDGATGQMISSILSAGEAPAGQAWKSVVFPSVGGEAVHGWLALPEGSGPFPAILHMHGGPTDVMLETYLPECQTWVERGYAFLTLNYHGSTTFGKDFEKSIIGRLGELEIQDMAAAYHWLVDNHIAKADAVFLSGYSYGGYLTLLAMGRYPELWAGGMAGIAIADWHLLYQDENETMRSFQRLMFGGSPQEKAEAYRRSSPMTYADHIQAPVLIIQGANDTRSPARQMNLFVEHMKSLGKDIESHWFNAGHGARSIKTQLEHMQVKLNFVERILMETS